MVFLRQFPVPTEGIRCEKPDVEALIDDQTLGKGTLYISEDIVSWINASTAEGFTIPYPKMTLHAISRDTSAHSAECLYIMVNGVLDNVEQEVEQNDDYDEDMTEVRFVPDDNGLLDMMYQAVQECTLLHPDAASDMSDPEDVDPDELFEGHEGGDEPGGIAEDDEDDENDEAQRLIMFQRMNLHFGGGGDTPDKNGNGVPPHDPDQFADAD